MKRVAELIYVVEEEREEFIKGAVCPSEEEKDVLWSLGVRNQIYFAINEYILMTFEYAGYNFSEDMKKMAAYLDTKGHLIKQRRKDVPVEERKNTNWWAPIKKLGTVLENAPASVAENDYLEEDYNGMLDGFMSSSNLKTDISYDEQDWEDLF